MTVFDYDPHHDGGWTALNEDPPHLAVSRVDPDLLNLVKRLPGSDRIILGLAGAPGAGKTTVAEALVRALGPSAVHVPMDGFHLSDNILTALGRLGRKGAPDTFDAHGYANLLQRIRNERDHAVYAPAFVRDLEQPLAGAIAIEPHHTVVISEGNYLLLQDANWRGLSTLFDEVWFLKTEAQLRTQRILSRHIEFGKLADVARDWVATVDEGNAELVGGTEPFADRVIDVTYLQVG